MNKMFRPIVTKLPDLSPLAGFCTKAPFRRRLADVNDVKLRGTVFSSPFMTKTGTRIVLVKTYQSPLSYVFDNTKSNWAVGQRVYVSGSISPLQTVINGKKFERFFIRGEKIFALENEGATSATFNADKNVTEIVANVATNISNGTNNDSFSVATHYSVKNENGEEEEKTLFYRIFVYADDIRKYVQKNIGKGNKIHIHGRIGYHEHKIDDGKKMRTGFVVAQSISKIV